VATTKALAPIARTLRERRNVRAGMRFSPRRAPRCQGDRREI
jgi:hypothetical protein